MSFPIPQNARGFDHQGGWKMDDIKYNPKQKRILEGKFQKIKKWPLFYISNCICIFLHLEISLNFGI